MQSYAARTGTTTTCKLMFIQLEHNSLALQTKAFELREIT